LIATIRSSSLQGSVLAPRSKSVMQRACAAALLAGGETILKTPGNSQDDLIALSIIQQLGATVQKIEGGAIKITSKGLCVNKPLVLECGESGLSCRLFTSIAALTSYPVTITGSGSLLQRPQHLFSKVFPLLSVQIITENEFLPLQVKGPLTPRNINVDGSMSSQYLSGLLMAYSASGISNVTITVDRLVSKPYVDLTLAIMEKFGLRTPIQIDYSTYRFTQESIEESSLFAKRNFKIEGDWSGAAFLLVAGALTGSIQIKGLSQQSLQADKKIIDVLQQAGANLKFDDDSIFVQSAPLHAFTFDATDSPDLFPPLIALASYCQGESRISGVERLQFKESNRSKALIEEFSKLGVLIREDAGSLVIQGVPAIKGGIVKAHHDHRIAMALAIAALRSTEVIRIEQAESVRKSYPDFFKDLAELRASVSLTN
jgi:3-phosphoshikimate 1-carboxyvinyltransferase